MKHFWNFIIGLVGYSVAGLGFALAGGTALSLPWLILIIGLIIVDLNSYIYGRKK